MFIERENGEIIGVFGRPQPGYAEEELPDDHPDIAAFWARRNSNMAPQLTMRQFRLGLLGSGLLGLVENAIDSMQDPAKTAARIEFEYAATVARNHPLVESLSSQLGLTDEQIDALWSHAAGL